jgi:hypothetical protein
LLSNNTTHLFRHAGEALPQVAGVHALHHYAVPLRLGDTVHHYAVQAHHIWVPQHIQPLRLVKYVRP